jgi:hypothetical protein
MKEQKNDLLISHNQIRLRSKPCTDSDFKWGAGNIEQGLVWHQGLVILDPLLEGTFGANIIIKYSKTFSADINAHRIISFPFEIINRAELAISSAAEEFLISIDILDNELTIIYEICLDSEVYYKFTLIDKKSSSIMALKEDGWGLKKGQILKKGVF